LKDLTEPAMTRPTYDVKILAAPGAALSTTAKHVWAAAAQAHAQVALAQLPDPSDWSLHGSPPLPAVLVNGHVVHAGSVPSSAQVKVWLHK
jgi:hypothetical protein